ncbi:MAG: hypothetical protein IJU75_06915 [Clostridia bacterium]|nr:hypothetical protein [Clostridia bacterium]
MSHYLTEGYYTIESYPGSVESYLLGDFESGVLTRKVDIHPEWICFNVEILQEKFVSTSTPISAG